MNANSEFSTDRITISRSTLKQALEALERARPLKADYTTLEYFEEAKRKHYAAMAALRAALAQQAEPDHETRAELAEQQNEPVAWNWMLDGQPYGQAYYGRPPDADIVETLRLREDRAVRLLYAATLQRKQAEPVQEPAAVVATQSDVWHGYNGQWAPPGEPIKMAMLLRDLPIGTLLYTAPPQQTVDGGVD